jgi:hypothetical protein
MDINMRFNPFCLCYGHIQSKKKIYTHTYAHIYVQYILSDS